MWWGHLRKGYTNNLKEAGLYSEKDIKSFMPKWFYEHQLPIKSDYVDRLNVSVFHINSADSNKLVEERKVIIGYVIYEDKDYF